MSFTYKYPRPALTADVLLFHSENERVSVLLVRRKFPPFEGKWALPGGFMNLDETLKNAARRELQEETSIIVNDLIPFHVFDEIGRDPRGRTITLTFYALLSEKPSAAMAGDDASELKWFDLDDLPGLAFDHRKIIALAQEEILKV